jgi:hypothetical protein
MGAFGACMFSVQPVALGRVCLDVTCLVASNVCTPLILLCMSAYLPIGFMAHFKTRIPAN